MLVEALPALLKNIPQEMMNEPRTVSEPKTPADLPGRYFLKKLIHRNPRSGKTGMSQASCKNNLKMF